MPRLPCIASIALLLCQGCRVLGPTDVEGWKQAHGMRDSGDTGQELPQDPPKQLCSEAWGTVSSGMEGDLRSVLPGSGMALLFWFEGPTDVCDIGCEVDWVDPTYLTADENYTLEEYWLDLPYRIGDDERVYAYFYVAPGEDETPGTEGGCWVETSAGTRTHRVAVAK